MPRPCTIIKNLKTIERQAAMIKAAEQMLPRAPYPWELKPDPIKPKRTRRTKEEIEKEKSKPTTRRFIATIAAEDVWVRFDD